MRTIQRFRHLAAMLLTGLVISCGIDAAPTAPPPPAPDPHLVGTIGNLVGSLLTCRPMPAQTDEEWIGPAGGRLEMGPHTLVIPAGALRQMTRIRGEIRRDTVNSVRLRPEGLEFARQATLTLDYSNCSLVGGLLTPKRIAYTSESLFIFYWLPSQDHPLQRNVSTRLDHFSRYAIGW